MYYKPNRTACGVWSLVSSKEHDAFAMYPYCWEYGEFLLFIADEFSTSLSTASPVNRQLQCFLFFFLGGF